MNYLLICALLFATGFLLTEACFRLRKKRYINIAVKLPNGAKKIVRINAGKDPEFDQLIKKAKKEQKAH